MNKKKNDLTLLIEQFKQNGLDILLLLLGFFPNKTWKEILDFSEMNVKDYAPLSYLEASEQLLRLISIGCEKKADDLMGSLDSNPFDEEDGTFTTVGSSERDIGLLREVRFFKRVNKIIWELINAKSELLDPSKKVEYID